MVRIQRLKYVECGLTSVCGVGIRYPVATMICQSFASMFVVLECMYALPPDLYVDSMGAPFTYFIVKCFSFAKVLAYVHYPIISEVSTCIPTAS